MNLLTILLQAQTATQQGNPYSFYLMLGLMVVVFYFFMIRPQQKRQKEIKKFQEALEVGKEVVTAGGIYGKIKEVKDRFVIVEISENVRVKLEKSSVFATVTETQQPAK